MSTNVNILLLNIYFVRAKVDRWRCKSDWILSSNHPVQFLGATFRGITTKHRYKLLQVLRVGPTEWAERADVPITCTSVIELGDVSLWAWS